MSEYELYDIVRGCWNASLKTIEKRNVKYVCALYHGLIVAVYQPDSWHYGHEISNLPQKDLSNPKDYERIKNRVYFVCNNYRNLDEEGKFYLYKFIQTGQNPIMYLSPEQVSNTRELF